MQTERAFEHLVESLNNPQRAEQNQKAFNEERYQDVLEALRVRPAFLPVQISMPAEVRTLPIEGKTNDLSYHVAITGAISDGEEKKINLRRYAEESTSFVSVSKDVASSQISLDAIAGKSLESGGRNGIQDFIPFLLRAGESISVDVFKPVATLGIDVVSIVFTGYRILTEAAAMESIDDKLIDKILDEIALRVTPEPRFAVCPVKFDANGDGTAETPKSSSESRMLLGFRTTVKNAMLNLGFDKDTKFARDYFPIWALCAEAGNSVDNFRMLKKPIYLKPGQQLYFGLKNTINGTTYATDGQIEVLEQTV